jgi:hypothetical protein
MVMFIYNLKAIYSFFSVERLTSVSGSSFIAFVGGVAGNIIDLVQGLGDAGIVGLVAAIIILNLYK